MQRPPLSLSCFGSKPQLPRADNSAAVSLESRRPPRRSPRLSCSFSAAEETLGESVVSPYFFLCLWFVKRWTVGLGSMSTAVPAMASPPPGLPSALFWPARLSLSPRPIQSRPYKSNPAAQDQGYPFAGVFAKTPLIIN